MYVLSVRHFCACWPWKPGEEARPLKTGGVDGCKPPCGSRDGNQIFQESK